MSTSENIDRNKYIQLMKDIMRKYYKAHYRGTGHDNSNHGIYGELNKNGQVYKFNVLYDSYNDSVGLKVREPNTHHWYYYWECDPLDDDEELITLEAYFPTFITNGDELAQLDAYMFHFM